MALRFRDLVQETIVRHKEVIATHGYVWWGWWNKPSEKIPRNTFAEFKGLITAGGGKLEIYLVDSGSEKLYVASLTSIDESPTEDSKSCSEPTKTPGYYSTATYKAWFRLTEIREISIAGIRNWSYDEVGEFLDDSASGRFQDKRVFSIQEMLNRRHRTIYFLKPYDSSNHQDYLLEFLPPVIPANFIAEPIVTNSNYVLHLSDVHFGVGHHNFPMEKDEPQRRKLSTLISDDIQRLYKGIPPAAIVISGDLTWQGHAEEFELVYKFIEELKSVFALGAHRFVIIPGNHDIQWGIQEENEYNKDKPVERPKEEAEQNYRDFYKRVFGLSANEFLSIGRRYILSNFIPLDIVGLNSSRLEQKHFAGYGYVSLEQLDDAAESIGWNKPKPKLMHRMLALHHHVTPVTSKEELEYGKFYSLTLDAGQLTYKALDYKVDLIVHGHMHQPFASTVSRAARSSNFPVRTLGVHGAGSAGVRRVHTGEIGKNSFSIIEFGDESVSVKIRSWSENFHGFEEDWTCKFVTDDGDGYRLKPI